MDHLRVTVRANDTIARRIRLRLRQVIAPDLLVVFDRPLLDPVHWAFHPRKARPGRHVEQDGEVRQWLVYRPNSSLHVSAGAIRYAEARRNGRTAAIMALVGALDRRRDR